MQSKLIKSLVMTNRVIFVLGFLLVVYLVFAVPQTKVVSDRQGELAQIDATSNLAELKAHASALAMVANNATHISAVLFGVVIVMLLFFVVLSILNLFLLRKLKSLSNQPDDT
jgi:hypothetical protein